MKAHTPPLVPRPFPWTATNEAPLAPPRSTVEAVERARKATAAVLAEIQAMAPELERAAARLEGKLRYVPAGRRMAEWLAQCPSIGWNDVVTLAAGGMTQAWQFFIGLAMFRVMGCKLVGPAAAKLNALLDDWERGAALALEARKEMAALESRLVWMSERKESLSRTLREGAICEGPELTEAMFRLERDARGLGERVRHISWLLEQSTRFSLVGNPLEEILRTVDTEAPSEFQASHPTRNDRLGALVRGEAPALEVERRIIHQQEAKTGVATSRARLGR